MSETFDSPKAIQPGSDKIRDYLMSQNHIDSSLLFNGQQELLIKHNEVMYRLQITKLDKLILTK